MQLNKNIKKFIVVTILAFCISFSPIFASKSYAWDAIPAASFKQMLEEISKRIEGIILGALKQQAAKMLNQQTNKLVGGGKGKQPMFITNWQSYLVKQPQNNTKVYMNDYLSKITSGKGSTTGYQSSSGIGGLLGSGSSVSSKVGSLISSLLGGGGGSYSSQLVQQAKKTVVSPPQPKMTFQGNPSKMLAQGNFKLLDSFLSGINNPWTFMANAAAENQKQLADQKKIAQTKAVAYQGFKGTGENKKGTGAIKTPGSLVKDNTANVQDIGNKIIAAATHPEEVISAVVTKMITQVITQGIGNVQQMISKQVNAMAKATGLVNGNIIQNGPGAAYKTQSSGININSLLK